MAYGHGQRAGHGRSSTLAMGAPSALALAIGLPIKIHELELVDLGAVANRAGQGQGQVVTLA